eukprot:TRINITY_DN80136_c0_g1_i1.p1 TRINITY_DN80136_c0_g1~~TRINITY_DN80136_c0_g1_i1.p1  ORF type:complete len:610 (+),score=84.05 TRINITY_DN80136_c0_g1_i1:79-1908(+)
MARRERACANTDAMPCVKLFVASTGWPYKPRWSPSAPVMIFSGGSEAFPMLESDDGHLVKRCGELVCALLGPVHDDVFVVDLSQMASRSEWAEELQHPGRAIRMLSKWLTKFNPADATLIVSGQDAGLFENIISSWKRSATNPIERPFERIIVAGNHFKKQLQNLAQHVRVDCVPQSVKLIAEAVGRSKGEQRDPVSLGELHVVSVDFTLDPESKDTKQTAVNITADVMCDAAPLKFPSGEFLDNSMQKVATHHLEFGVSVNDMRVQVLDCKETDSMKQLVLADCHGSIHAVAPHRISGIISRGCHILVSGRVMSMGGCMVLLLTDARQPEKAQIGYASVKMGQRNMSQRQHHYGCLILRGSQCVLVRKESDWVLPHALPIGCESGQQTATRATKAMCSIFSEEFALLADVSPAVAYDVSGSETTVQTIFAAVATQLPEKARGCGCGISCGCGSPSQGCCGDNQHNNNEGLCDWFTYDGAMSVLKRQADRNCLAKLTASLVEAIDAGVLLMSNKGAFRPGINAIDTHKSFNEILALTVGPQPGRAAMLTNAENPQPLKSAMLVNVENPQPVKAPDFASCCQAKSFWRVDTGTCRSCAEVDDWRIPLVIQ